MALSPCAWFQSAVDRALDRWMERCMPCPSRIVRGRFVNPRIIERQTPLEVPMQEISITAPADTKFGYTGLGIRWENAAGAPVSVDPATVSATSSNPDVCEDVRFIGGDGGEFFFNPKDAADPGSSCVLTFSAVETGDQDDVRVNYTVGADRLMGVADGITITERTEPLA